MKSLLPAKDVDSFRFLSDEKDLNKQLKKLKKEMKAPEFKDKKERINYFKEQSKIQTVEHIVQVLLQLKSIDDRGTIEDNIYAKLKKTLALECHLVLEISEKEAKAMIKQLLEA
jgi:RNA polymerase-interacting CarD/CdnL/TRCF family regulator